MISGFGNQHLADSTNNFFALIFETYTGTNLDNAGESLRYGQSLQVILKDAGIS